MAEVGPASHLLTSNPDPTHMSQPPFPGWSTSCPPHQHSEHFPPTPLGSRGKTHSDPRMLEPGFPSGERPCEDTAQDPPTLVVLETVVRGASSETRGPVVSFPLVSSSCQGSVWTAPPPQSLGILPPSKLHPALPPLTAHVRLASTCGKGPWLFAQPSTKAIPGPQLAPAE